MFAGPQLLDCATVVPAVTVHDRRFVRCEPAQVSAILQCMCVVDQPTEHEDEAAEATITLAPSREELADRELFCLTVWTLVEAAPDAHRLRVISPPTRNAFVECLLALMCVRDGLGRCLSCEIVQPHLLPVAGWSKGFIWRAHATRLGGLSPALVVVLADRMQRLATTSIDVRSIGRLAAP